MVRARNSIGPELKQWKPWINDITDIPMKAKRNLLDHVFQGWGEWSDVVVVTLDDPKWEKQQRKEAETQARMAR